MDRYTISDLEKLTGIMSGTIRIWERRYRIIKPHRTDTNRRWYDNDDLKRILNIAILYRKGIKISTIATFSGAEIEEKVKLLTKESTDIETHLDALIVAMSDLDEDSINNILMRSIINKGFEATFTEVVFPFLRRVGIMWHTGSVDIGSEHFVSNIFRKRLITAIDSLSPPDNPDKKKFVLYLPENELHEMGLLFYTYIIRKEGHSVMYLGQSTPFVGLRDLVERWHPDYLVTGALTSLPFGKPEDYLRRIGTAFRDQVILVSGVLTSSAGKISMNNVVAFESVNDLRKYL
ncbi:MAG: MerR family transcriptional regulator [Actinomycetota bacterium]|jgi:DNA-binding transcriptional MerR regulator